MPGRKTLALVFSMVLALSALAAAKPAAAGGPTDALYQISTIDALLAGNFGGYISLGRYRQAGDFGLGTLDKLNGEMVMIDGVIYRVDMQGKTKPLPPHIGTPWAEAAFFKPDITFTLTKPQDLAALEKAIDAHLPSANLFYAVKVSGQMVYLKARSVPEQKQPFPRLVEAIKHQAVFKYKNIEGDLVGFRCPGYTKGLAVPGYHFHFIDAQRKLGGHVLACLTGPVQVAVDVLYGFQLDLPKGGDFLTVDLSGDKSDELKKVEK